MNPDDSLASGNQEV